MDTKDGGRAFPQIDSAYNPDRHEYTGHVYSAGGMSLRDDFAGQALIGADKWAEPDACAAWCYAIAGAMLKARKKA